MKYRRVIVYKDYFKSFMVKQRANVQNKIEWTLNLIEDTERVPEKFLKHLTGTDGLYEIRVELGSDAFRIFCFFYKGNLIVLANGFHKKTQKTPPTEITKALKIKQEYEASKR